MKKLLLAQGKFDIDKNNRLLYWLNEPKVWRREYDLPNKIRFIGNWHLNSNYDLELILDETKGQRGGDRLVLKGEIISTDRDTLAFEIISRNETQGLSPSLSHRYVKGTVPEPTHIRILKLSGFWQADEYNRLCFMVKKKASPDILTLEGIWQINHNQQIIYAYEKADLKTKTKISHTLTFEGFWQINSANRLRYILTRSTKSRFDFRVQAESPNIYPQEGVIKYRLGIGLKGLSPKGTVPIKIISLYGAWKFKRKVGLTFEMDYGQGKSQSIEFGSNIYLSKKDEVIFSLANKRREPLGIYITFTHRFLKKHDAETFLYLKKSKEETRIDAGVRIPF